MRTLIVLMTGILAMSIPKFGMFINLTGAFACTALAFILPTLMYNELYKQEMAINVRRFHYVLITFGTVCGTISFFMSMQEIIKAFSEESI